MPGNGRKGKGGICGLWQAPDIPPLSPAKAGVHMHAERMGWRASYGSRTPFGFRDDPEEELIIVKRGSIPLAHKKTAQERIPKSGDRFSGKMRDNTQKGGVLW